MKKQTLFFLGTLILISIAGCATPLPPSPSPLAPTATAAASDTPALPAAAPSLAPFPKETAASPTATASPQKTSPSPAPTGTTSRPSTAPTATAPAGQMQVTENENGKTITVSPGTLVMVILQSTYWQFQGSSDPKVLRQLGEPKVAPNTPGTPGRIPGLGTGTVSLQFQAVAPGRADISASRTTCGEALLCPENQRSFKTTVIVK